MPSEPKTGQIHSIELETGPVRQTRPETGLVQPTEAERKPARMSEPETGQEQQSKEWRAIPVFTVSDNEEMATMDERRAMRLAVLWTGEPYIQAIKEEPELDITWALALTTPVSAC